MKMNNPVYLAVARVLNDANIPHRRLHRSKHEAVQFDLDGNLFSVIIPVSPSDRFAPRAARAFVRRILRQQHAKPALAT